MALPSCASETERWASVHQEDYLSLSSRPQTGVYNYHLLHNQLSCHTLSSRTSHWNWCRFLTFLPCCCLLSISITFPFSPTYYLSLSDFKESHMIFLTAPLPRLLIYIFLFWCLSTFSANPHLPYICLLLLHSSLAPLCCASTLIAE